MSEHRAIPITPLQARLIIAQQQRLTEMQAVLHAQISVVLAGAGIERATVVKIDSDPPAIVVALADDGKVPDPPKQDQQQ